jgi:general secretion pathway protein J
MTLRKQGRALHPPRRRAGERARGFTLLEVMLATGVAAFVLVAVSGIFFGALTLRNRATAAIESRLPLERALRVLQQDLSQVIPPGGTLGGVLQTSGDMTRQAGQVSPEFYTASGPITEYAPWPDVQKVAYLLLDSTNGAAGRDLYRAVWRNLLSPVEDLPEQEWLLGNVEDIRFLFHDGTQWRTEWDSTVEETPLPRGVKVELQLAAAARDDELPPPVELVIPLWVDGATNDTAASVEVNP